MIVNQKKDNIEFIVIPKTSEEYISVSYSSIRVSVSFQFLSKSIDKLTNSFNETMQKPL